MQENATGRRAVRLVGSLFEGYLKLRFRNTIVSLEIKLNQMHWIVYSYVKCQ